MGRDPRPKSTEEMRAYIDFVTAVEQRFAIVPMQPPEQVEILLQFIEHQKLRVEFVSFLDHVVELCHAVREERDEQKKRGRFH